MKKNNIEHSVAVKAILALAISAALMPASTRAAVLEEVLVTAQKREQNLQDVPISVAVLTGAELAERNQNEISELSKMIPGFSFGESTSDAGKSVILRGVGTQSFSRGVEQSVGTVVDGVVASGTVTALLDLSDVARVEVLRGPQGMLFGKNASAGLINITTNRPTQELSAGIGASYADENEIKVNGYLSGPIVGDSVLGRLSFYSNERDAIIENVYPGGEDYNNRNEWGVTGKLAFSLGDNLDMLLAVTHNERDHVCCAQLPEILVPGSIADVPGSPSGKENDKIMENDKSVGTTDLDVYSFEVNYSLGEHVLTSLTSYTEDESLGDFRGLALPVTILAPNRAHQESEQFTQEFRITSPGNETLDYVAGLYYYKYDQDRDFFRFIDLQALGFAPFPLKQSLINETAVEKESFSAFGQLTWNFSERARMSVGARYNHDEVSLDQTVSFVPGNLPEAPPGTLQTSVTDEAMSWRIIGEYNVADDAMLYASVARGYKGPGANTLASGVTSPKPIVDPEIPTSYEIGLKSEWWGGAMRLNAAVFYTVFEDFQASASRPSEGETIVVDFYLDNAGELETQGVEIEASGQASDQLSWSVAVAYIDATFSDYANAACYAGQGEEQGCVDSVQDLTGADLPNSPEWSYTLGARYDVPFESMPFDGFIRGSYFWRDDVQFALNNNPSTMGDSYGIADISIGVNSKDGTYSAQLFVKNLFDEFYTVNAGGGAAAGIELYHGLDYTYTQRIGVAAQYNF